MRRGQPGAGRGWAGATLGTVVTLRDHTDLRALTGELDTTRGLAESLRAQAHEAANRLHTVVSLHRARPHRGGASSFATAELAGRAARSPTGWSARVAEPVLAALLLGKAAEAAERGVDLGLEGTERTRTPGGRVAARATSSRSSATCSTTPSTPRWTARQPAPGAGAGAPGATGELVAAGRATADRAWTRRRPSARSPAAGRTKPGGDRPQGRGLGLALVGAGRAPPRRHGRGRRARGGAEFTVRLPLRRAACRAVSGRPARSGCSSSRTSRSPPTRTRPTSAGCRASRSSGVAAHRADARRCARSRPGRSTSCCSTCTCPTGTAWTCVRAMRAAGPPADVHRGDPRARPGGGPGRGPSGDRAVPAQAVRLRGAARQAGAVRALPRAARARRRAAGSRTRSTARWPRCAAPAGTGLPKGRQRARRSTRCRAAPGRTRRRPRRGRPTTSASSRVTARRYLEHLSDRGMAERQPRYGGTGRPEVEYRLL